jgi:hypothetical protein
VLERARQAAADDPGVERVVGMLDEDRRACEVEKGTARVRELRRVGDHLLVDLVALAGVRVDRRATVDERVEEAERPREVEALGADLQHQERPVAGRLDIERHVLDLVEAAAAVDRGRLVEVERRRPLDRVGAPRLQPQYAFLWVKTRNRVISRILRSNARLQFSM